MLLAFMKSVHVELSNERGNVGVLEVLTRSISIYSSVGNYIRGQLYLRTFENSFDGDITKLSFVFDHDIRC
jgi:hypothetical protein